MKLSVTISSIIGRIVRFIKCLLTEILCVPIVDVYYGGFWKYREYLIRRNGERSSIYNAYLERQSASIGLTSIFKSKPTFPHGLHGIHISDGAEIGENVIIFQNVTIGSNTLADSKHTGAPQIGDNVFIGANASIIGGITVGYNCRIGANCCVYENTPANHTVVGRGNRLIDNGLTPLDNAFYYFSKINSKNE